MGDIGRPLKHIEFEPIPDDVPQHEPAAPDRAPEPVKVPEPDKELEPA